MGPPKTKDEDTYMIQVSKFVIIYFGDYINLLQSRSQAIPKHGG